MKVTSYNRFGCNVELQTNGGKERCENMLANMQKRPQVNPRVRKKEAPT